jgi:hypothetical protein
MTKRANIFAKTARTDKIDSNFRTNTTEYDYKCCGDMPERYLIHHIDPISEALIFVVLLSESSIKTKR